MKKILIVYCLASFFVICAGSQELYVPAAAHSSGLSGTHWRSDLEVKARGESPASFTVELLEENRNNSQASAAEFTVAAGHSMRLGDVVGDIFGFEGNAAIRITTLSGAIQVSSRTYNDDPEGSFGQFIPAFPAEEAVQNGFDYSLIQLSESTNFRTNMCFLNTSALDIVVEIDLYTASGLSLGSLEYTLRPYELRQETNIYDAVTNDNVDAGYALVRTRSEGGTFFAGASVIDNRTGDAIFIPAQFDGPSPEELQPRFVVFESFMRDG